MIDNLNLLFVYAPIMNIQVILDGIFVGAVFALSAYGLALVWGVMNVKNLAQGDFVIMGGFIALGLHEYLGIHPIISIPIVLILMFAYGWAVYKLIIKRVIDNDMFVSLLATFGLSLLMQQVMNLIYGPEVRIIDPELPIYEFFDFITVPMAKIISLILAAIFALIITIFMKKSRMGQAIRATAQDARAARVLGINTDNVYAFTFALNAAICGVAGVMVSIIWVLQPFYGITYSLRTFAIVTAAGLGNLPAVIGTGFVLGLIEKYTSIILGVEYEIAAAVVMLLVVLMWRQIQMRKNRQAVR
ncbi:MAG: branched-chain amino acid ABC transporter permease [Rhodobacterales bacterium]|jgi:branched-chain amino acid transport system permease protein|nr:branched-chain amino acid ABC transporter permease [Rhodobacterales bacterium]MBT4133368.1 branched-chain amino acid ABC transporter permease [Rhodobacterales bacterium]MBT5486882.1 branched-chain amino acid ABC transporter permease [Deltaproteobacteria bacterium]MBT5834406.1 branched-chain amino acid ABC transporter permease [Deltaproteobacteria bacterium]|tara:strand:- start:2838 stop:3743 length:906 start_codon:yes stop_codon:yes gene_type:complete